jgi:hydrogenase maturation protein HypF
MIERSFNAPLTSSAGRLFDAVAALAGVRDVTAYEGQAAVELEGLAAGQPDGAIYPFDVETEQPGDGGEPLFIVDTRPLIRAVARDVTAGTSPAAIARRFHATLADVIAAVSRRLRDATRLNDVVLSGGVFLNAVLTTATVDRLTAAGFRVFRHRLVPPNDGGLCLGQVAIAAAQAGDCADGFSSGGYRRAGMVVDWRIVRTE